MSWKKVSAEIDKVRRIVEGWEQSGQIDILDREVVLDKLRSIYEQVKFADIEVAKNAQPAETAVVAEKAPQSEPVKEEAAEPVVSAHHAESSEASTDSPEEKLELMDDLLLRRGRDKKAIMSLYGDKEEPVKESKEAVFTPEPVVESAGDDALGIDVLGAIGIDEAPQAAKEETEKEEAPSAPHSGGHGVSGQDTKKVLGETIRHGETLADLYARNNHQQDVAGKINSGRLSSIRSAVGINDKFLLMRDLFGGDAARYDITITELDSFADLDDALLYIHDNFRWNPDSDGVKLLMELLTRKL